MARQVILNCNDEDNILIETDFSQEELEECADKIREDISDAEDDGSIKGIVLKELEKRGYIKVIGAAPEIYEIYIV